MSDPAKTSIDPFRYMVQRFIEMESPNLIQNSSPEHARILLEEMFLHTKTSAYVYCGRISDEVWGGEELAAAVRKAIENGIKVRFIVQHPEKIPEGSAVAAVLRQHGEGMIHTSALFAALGSHFAVFDEKMYRFEKSDDDKTAIACVNGPDTARKLRDLALSMLDVA